MAEFYFSVTGLNEVISRLNKYQQDIKPKSYSRNEDMGKEVLDDLVSYIKSGSAGVRRSQGKDPRPWVSSGELLSKLSTVSRVEGNKHHAFAGAESGVIHSGSGKDLAELAKELEFGTGKRAPLPVLHTFWQGEKSVVTKKWEDFVKDFFS